MHFYRASLLPFPFPPSPYQMAEVAVSNSIYQKSPLDTLVRQSSRRAQNSPRLQIPPQKGQHSSESPSSPLLHTRFRAPGATTSTSFINLNNEEEDDTVGMRRSQAWVHEDSESSYTSDSDSPARNDFQYVIDPSNDQHPPSSPTPSSPSGAEPEKDRLSWASDATQSTLQLSHYVQNTRDTWRSSANSVDPFAFRHFESPERGIPQLIVTSPTKSLPRNSVMEADSISSGGPIISRSAPSITQYSVANFSRPIRSHAASDEQSKWHVLERNRSQKGVDVSQHQFSYQSGGSTSSLQSAVDSSGKKSPPNNRPQQYNGHKDQTYFSPSNNQTVTVQRAWNASSPAIHSHSIDQRVSTSPSHVLPPSNSRSRNTSPSFNGGNSGPRSDEVVVLNTSLGYIKSTSPEHAPTSSKTTIKLPAAPPQLRPSSKLSLYSTYSFYQLDDDTRTPSPSSPQHPQQEGSNSRDTRDTLLANPRSSRSPSPAPSQPVSTEPSAEDYLYMGIQHHEANRLTESARCFHLAATLNGGCGVGMLMWGLTLRHAWGTQKDEKAAFRWLRRAAEAAVDDLEAAREGQEQVAVRVSLLTSTELSEALFC